MAGEGDPRWDLVAAPRTLPRQSCSLQSTSSTCLWLTLTGLNMALPGHPRPLSDTDFLTRHDPDPYPHTYILSPFLGSFPVLNPCQFLSGHECPRLIKQEGSLVPVPAVQLQLQLSQAMVFQRAPSPQPQLLSYSSKAGKKPSWFQASGEMLGHGFSLIKGRANGDSILNKRQSKWWFSFDSKPLAKGRDNLALPLFTLKGYFSTSITSCEGQKHTSSFPRAKSRRVLWEKSIEMSTKSTSLCSS